MRAAEADDRDRRQADPLAHHEDLRRPTASPTSSSACGYKGYVIKEYFANYFLHASDVTFDLARQRGRGAPEQRRAVAGDARRHRRRHDDRRAAASACSATSATRSSASPTATASATSTSRALVDFHRRQGALATVTAVQPPGRFGALEIARRARHAASRRSRTATADGSTAASSCCRPRWLDYIDGRRDDLGARAARAARARRAARRVTSTTASGSRWTRCATSAQLRGAVGRRARRPWKAALDSSDAAPQFWRGRRVLVTGHTGFKGSWLSPLARSWAPT